jgi:transcriptional regulator GlxA family with amidase domain
MIIQALVFDGFEEMDLVGMYEPLRLVPFEVAMRSLREQTIVKAAYGLSIVVSKAIDVLEPPDLLLIPGGGWLSRARQGAWAEAQNGEILDIIRKLHDKGTILASVCTGSLLIASAGLLKGRPATTNHQALKELEGLGAKVIDARVVDDGEIITAGGITSSIDLALHLIDRFASTEEALRVSELIEFEQRGPIWRRCE